MIEKMNKGDKLFYETLRNSLPEHIVTIEDFLRECKLDFEEATKRLKNDESTL